jgi:hypothetical protein
LLGLLLANRLLNSSVLLLTALSPSQGRIEKSGRKFLVKILMPLQRVRNTLDKYIIGGK